MTPINQVLRLWLRRASAREKGLATVATVIVVGLLGWAVLPIEAPSTGNTNLFAGGPGTGPVGADSTTPTVAGTDTTVAAGLDGADGAPDGVNGVHGVNGVNSAAGPAGTAGPNDPAATTGPACLPGTDQGATASELKLGAAIVELAGTAGNSAVGLPSPADQRATYNAVVDSLNKDGGIACRKVSLSFQTVNPTDKASPRQACLNWVPQKLFAVLDAGFLAQAIPCLAENAIPIFQWNTIAISAQAYYPWVFGMSAFDLAYRNGSRAFRDAGFFDPAKGFKKVGVPYHDCNPEYVATLMRALQEVVPKEAIIPFNFSCGNGIASPQDMQQAILTFKRENVTVVTPAFMPLDFGAFTKVARAQDFKPQYGIADPAIIMTANGPLGPDWTNIDGAMAVVNVAFGEERTPGARPNADTQKCDAILRAGGQPTSWAQYYGGIVCGLLWGLEATVERSGQVARTTLPRGMQAVGKSMPAPYPSPPSEFGAPGVTYGGQYWRAITAVSSCSCFRLADPTWRPSYR